MNDKEFRENCKMLANDIVENTMGLRRQLKVPQSWCDSDNFGDLQAAALLYIAVNMPNLNDKEDKPEVSQDKCPYCAGGEVTLTSFESEAIEDSYIKLLFDPEDKTLTVRDDASHIEGCVDIEYCPFCKRAL